MYEPEHLKKEVIIIDEEFECDRDTCWLTLEGEFYYTKFNDTFDTLYWLLKRTKANPYIRVHGKEYRIIEMIKSEEEGFLITIEETFYKKIDEIKVTNPHFNIPFTMEKYCINLLKEFAKCRNISYTTFLENKIRLLHQKLKKYE